MKNCKKFIQSAEGIEAVTQAMAEGFEEMEKKFRAMCNEWFSFMCEQRKGGDEDKHKSSRDTD